MSSKTALITGASAGIGEELAKIFAADGHNLILVARRREKLEALASKLAEAHEIKTLVVAADLAEPGAAQRVFDQVQDAGLEVDFLVNNAGFGSTGKFWELETQGEVNQIQVNVTALVHLTRLFLPQMIERGFGRVLNIASTAGFQAGPFMSTYYATKAFVVSFTEGIAFELKGSGVTATAHCPGATESEFAAVSGNSENKLFTQGGVASTAVVAHHAYDSMNAGKALAIQGFTNALGAFLVRLSPRGVVQSMVAKLNQP